jgi:phosphoglycolate phosphatase
MSPSPPPARTMIRLLRPLRVAGVVIDLDGTLLDTAPDLVAAANAMRAELDLPPLPFDTVMSYVGKGADVLVHRSLTGALDGQAEPALFAAGREAFLRWYTDLNGRETRDYPGVREGLAAMRAAGLRLAVVTNKPIAFAVPLLALTGLSAHFELVIGGDTLPWKKPDPAPMLHACARLGLPPERVVAIGDSINDALAARAAGMPVLAVPYGYNEGRDVRELDVDGIVDSLSMAADWLQPG